MTKDETGAEHHVNYTGKRTYLFARTVARKWFSGMPLLIRKTGSVKDKFLCPSCNAEITKKSCERAVKSFYKTYIANIKMTVEEKCFKCYD